MCSLTIECVLLPSEHLKREDTDDLPCYDFASSSLNAGVSQSQRAPPPPPPYTQPPPPAPTDPSQVSSNNAGIFPVQFRQTSDYYSAAPNETTPGTQQAPARPPPPPPSSATSQPPPPPPSSRPPAPRQSSMAAEKEIAHRELSRKGYVSKDIDVVLAILGYDVARASKALADMNSLRSEGFDRDTEAWNAWLIAKYLPT
eukprot:Tamp_12278.p1 GENE.Tamp_12278~~Tamp_12278.p1  ORF type:complete len:200 (+),score=18.98 Tamp_12278:163-762(+)